MFFFSSRRRHTRSLRDWSSDVCSSDLLDDTDVERNTEASVASIFEGLRWLDLGWDEDYKQSERLGLHRQIAEAIFQKGLAYRDFTPAHTGDSEKSGPNQTWLF